MTHPQTISNDLIWLDFLAGDAEFEEEQAIKDTLH